MSIDSFHASFQTRRMVEYLNWLHDLSGANPGSAGVDLKVSQNALTAKAFGLCGPAKAVVSFIARQPVDGVSIVGSYRRDRIARKDLRSKA